MKSPTVFQRTAVLAVLVFIVCSSGIASGYENFNAAVYARAYEVDKMKDPDWLRQSWDTISSQLHVDKIYLETHRDLLIVDDETLEAAKVFFESRGVEVAGGITYTIDESNLFETYCYSNPEHLRLARKVIELSARHFDEVILDDFFFTSCKCERCIEGKGDQSWTHYRLKILNEAARDWILGPAKSVNPNVKVIIKYPNWYEHFQGLGFDLEKGPSLFDGIYTGTETRDAVLSNQHLQPYHGFLILRYFSHLAPGRNGGGWVDPFGSLTLERYAEQLFMTLLAKAPEMTLFDYRMMLARMDRMSKSSWQNEQCIWKWEEMLHFLSEEATPTIEDATYARAAGYALDLLDPYLENLGTPIAIPSYKPFHSTGEDFLQSYIGMLGIPIEVVSEFPEETEAVLLTAAAAHDPEIVSKIKARLRSGRDVIITSGLLEMLQGNGIEQIADLRISGRKALSPDFLLMREKVEGLKPILFPQLDYLTNDSWSVVEVLDGDQGWPVYHFAPYAGSRLWIWVIPDEFSDLYHLPVPVLNSLRERVGKPLGLWLQGPAKVALFPYDNQTAVVYNFLDEAVEVSLVTEDTSCRLNTTNGEALAFERIPEKPLRGNNVQPERLVFKLTLPAHGFLRVSW